MILAMAASSARVIGRIVIVRTVESLLFLFSLPAYSSPSLFTGFETSYIQPGKRFTPIARLDTVMQATSTYEISRPEYPAFAASCASLLQPSSQDRVL